MGKDVYHGKRIGSKCFKLYSLGLLISKKRQEFRCDISLTRVQQRNLWSCTAYDAFDSSLPFLKYIDITATHIPGVNNAAADMLSRNHSAEF